MMLKQNKINLCSTFVNNTRITVNMRSALVLVVSALVVYNSEALKVPRYDDGEWHVMSNYPQADDTYGYSAGSGLRSIAQGSASRAHSAVSNQYVAAQQAAYIAQTSLAQEAIQAAATANAALAGKEVLYKGLEKQVSDAQEALAAEVRHLKLAESTAQAAQDAAHAAEEHISILATALDNANAAVGHAKLAAEEAVAELASQSAMVGRAHDRLHAVKASWHSSGLDYEATKMAAENASAAARAARENASNAGAYASHKLQESALSNNAEEVIINYELPNSHHYRHRQ